MKGNGEEEVGEEVGSEREDEASSVCLECRIQEWEEGQDDYCEVHQESPELRAISEAIGKYIKLHKGHVCVVANITAFDEKNEMKDYNVIAFGGLDELRISLNCSRDIVEDTAEEGFVST